MATTEEDLRQALTHYWGYADFRSHQLEVRLGAVGGGEGWVGAEGHGEASGFGRGV
jgi:hypothetical protein